MNMRNTIALSSALLLSTSLHAALDKDGTGCIGDALCADRTSGGFYGSVSGNWVRPTETDVGMVTDNWQTTNADGSTLDGDRSFEPSHEFEWGFSLGYDFENSANSIEFNYFHLKNTTHAVNTFNGESLFTSYFFPGAAFAPFPGFVSDAQLSYKLEQADIKFSRKYTQFSEWFSLKPAVGVRYAELKHDLTFAAPGFVRSEFSGAGPMLSMDGAYMLGKGFRLLGYVDTSLLVGQTDSNSNISFAGGNASYTVPDRDRVVATLTARIGLDYVHMMQQAAFSAEVGYQVSEYFNAFDLIRGNVAFAPTLVGAGINEINTTSFAFSGPYLKIGVHV